jgi:hypothetical protein
MARNDNASLLSRVTTVLSRLDDKTAPKLPASLAADVKAFRAGVGPYVAAAGKAASALGVRDAALQKVGDADATLDLSIDELANARVGAKAAKRTRPFEGVSSLSPSKIQGLAYKKEVEEVNDLLAALAETSPPAVVKSVAAKVRKNATTVQQRLDALTGPEASYVKARTARDALAPDASKALGRFKLRAKGALVDDPGTYEALFGARNPVQAPARAKRKKNGAKAANGAGDKPAGK